MSKNENSTEGKLDAVYPELARRWRLVAEKMWNEHKLMIRVTEGLRDYKDQLAIWNKGRQKDKSGKWFISEPKKVVTFAMPGQSYHQYGLAIDICFQGSDPYLEKIDKKDAEFLWSEYGRFCKEVGLEWGGVWKGKKMIGHIASSH
jgi:peptidoglycan L-alanyl-D-glutamate endopeptidase CwlK